MSHSHKEMEEMFLDTDLNDLPSFILTEETAEDKCIKAIYASNNKAIDIALSPIEQTLRDRNETHGKFATQALISQSMKKRVRDGKNWSNMDADMRESIDMILHKVARIVNGDPYHLDSWHDISGYATLVENRLLETK